jgi:putative intracellular protease/amidase
VALIDGFADWECALLMGALRSEYAAEVRVASRDRSSVTSMGGLPVAPDLAFDAIAAEAFDAIVFPGGAGWLGPTPDDVVRLLLHFREVNGLIGAICAATGALADVGLLDTIPHTGNSPESLNSRANYRGTSFFIDEGRAVEADRIVTAPGIAPVSFASEVLKALGLLDDSMRSKLAQFWA